MPFHLTFSYVCLKCKKEIGAPKQVKTAIDRPCACINLLNPDEIVMPDAAIVHGGFIFRELLITPNRGIVARQLLGKADELLKQESAAGKLQA